MLSRLPRCVFKSNLFLHSARPSLPCVFQSVYKWFGLSAVRFQSQSPFLDLLPTTTSVTQGALDSPVEGKLPSSLPKSSFHVVYLRDSCTCSCCIDPSTRQKLFETADIPNNIQGNVVGKNSDGSVTVAWQNDIPGYENHHSTYTSHFITSSVAFHFRLAASHNSEPRATPWDQKIMASHSAPIDYETFIGSSAALFLALNALEKFGMIFLCNVPSQSDAISHISNRIGLIRNTIYGSTWDVRSVPSAKNVAYTSSHLGFHMDLLYMADPPKLQVLHCLRASKEGGESLFSDTLHAVETMREQRQISHLESLANFPVTYWYKNDGFNFQHTKRTIEMLLPHGNRRDQLGFYPKTIEAVNWSPPFQAPFLFDIGQPHKRLSKYLEAIKVFKRLIEDPASVLETKLDEGTCVIFDNRRIVHARRAFSDGEGRRWLRGAYVDKDAFRSRFRILKEKQAAGTLFRHQKGPADISCEDTVSKN